MDAVAETKPAEAIPQEFDPLDQTTMTEGASRPRNPDGTFAPVKPTSQEQPPSPEPEQPKAPVLSGYRQHLNRQAEEMGFSDAEIGDMTDQHLSIAINKMLRQQAQFQSEQLALQTRHEAEVRRPDPNAPVEDDYDLGIPREQLEQFNPEVLGVLKAIGKKAKAEVDAVRQELGQVKQVQQQRTMAGVVAMIDDAFEDMGPDWEEVLGKGPGAEMAQAQPAHFRRRVALLNEAGVDMNNPPTVKVLKKKLVEAANTLYGFSARGKPKPKEANPYADASEQPPNGSSRISPEDWQEGAVNRPTQRKATELPNGDEKAIKTVAEKLREERAARPADEISEFFAQ